MGEIRTKKGEIADYWFNIVDESGLSVDASEAIERCWRCGYKARLERCHIIPKSLGGSDSANNLVLLCKRCHIENPNINDPEIMWDWIRAYGTPFYDTFWVIEGMKEYEFIYGKSFEDEIKDREVFKWKVDEILAEVFKKTSIHYGHPHLNRATLAGIIRMALKQYDNNHSFTENRDNF